MATTGVLVGLLFAGAGVAAAQSEPADFGQSAGSSSSHDDSSDMLEVRSFDVFALAQYLEQQR